MNIKKYLTYFKVSFSAFFTYKADFLVGIFFNMVFFFIYFALWKAIYTTNGGAEIHTYTLANTVTYYFIITLIFRFGVTDNIWLGQDIWSGSFTNDLVKPWNAIYVHILTTLSVLSIELLLFLPFAIFIFVFAFSYIILPAPILILCFIVTLILGIFLNFVINFTIHALTFHFGDQEGNIGLVNYLISFLAGGVFPLAFLPENIKQVFMFFPFRYIFDFPANVFLGKVPLIDIYIGWAQMLIWGLAILALFLIIYKKGLNKYTGTGR
jgi:ABC-2 type transport system permease protein